MSDRITASEIIAWQNRPPEPLPPEVEKVINRFLDEVLKLCIENVPLLQKAMNTPDTKWFSLAEIPFDLNNGFKKVDDVIVDSFDEYAEILKPKPITQIPTFPKEVKL